MTEKWGRDWMDVLGDILRIVRLKGSVYFNACFCEPWGMAIEESQKASFHLIVKGEAWLTRLPENPNEPEKRERIHLKEGDLVLFPTGGAHMISHGPDGKCWPAQQVIDAYQDGLTFFTGKSASETNGESIEEEGKTENSQIDNFNIVCGYVEFDRSLSHPFLDNLPDMIHISAETRARFHWLDSIINHMVFESANKQPGTDVLIDRFTEILFIQVLRSYADLSVAKENYLSALVDHQLSKALSLIHDNPDKDWTVDLLALEVGMSRSSFYNRFNNYIGMPPMKYLFEWRMMQAKEKIEGTQKSLTKVAEEVGYQSDSAFQKAFKRFFNFTPASLRKSKK